MKTITKILKGIFRLIRACVSAQATVHEWDGHAAGRVAGQVVGAAMGLVALVPNSASAVNTCDLWQESRRVISGGACTGYTAPYDPAPVPNAAMNDPGGTFFPRVVPKCKDGTNTTCSSPDYIRNIDGTRPFYHVDPVVGSNKWIFFFEGGGSCGKYLGNEAEVDCWNRYNTIDWKEMSSQQPSATSTDSNVKSQQMGYGINSAVNGNFTGWNRVWIQKGTFDRFQGNTTYTSRTLSAAPMPAGDFVKLYYHGRRIIKAVMNDLDRAQGSTLYFPALPQPGATPLSELSSATHMMFAGQSGGAGGLVMNAEWLKGLANSISAGSKVTFVLDARMLPDAGTEAYFENPSVSLWTADYSGTTVVQEDDSGTNATNVRSNQTYTIAGDDYKLVSTWGNIAGRGDLAYLDAGCKAAHPGGGHVQCFDERHVFMHHFDENVFVHQTLLDGTHGNTPMTWVDTVNGNPADPGFYFNDEASSNDYMYDRVNRVLYMGDELIKSRKIAGKRDSGTTPNNSVGLYMVFGNKHTTIQNQEFFNHFIHKNGYTDLSFNDTLKIWVDAINGGSTVDRCWVQDASEILPSKVTYEVTANPAPECQGWAATW